VLSVVIISPMKVTRLALRTRLPCALSLLLASPCALASTSPDWITETTHEFLATGRFHPGSNGSDLLVLDKATGLARLGHATANGFTWSELATGMDGITGFTTLRNGPLDRCVASSATWNALQFVPPDGSPETRSSPVPGPHTLLRLSTGHAANAVVEDLLVFSAFGDSPLPHRTAGVAEDGTSLFESGAAESIRAAQFIPLGTEPSIPVFVRIQGEHLRVESIQRDGLAGNAWDASGPHAQGFQWAAAPAELFVVPGQANVLEQHRVEGTPVGGGSHVASRVVRSVVHPLPEAVASVDTVPFSDPSYPALRCLVALRWTSSPNIVRLYRVLDAPPSIEEMMTLETSPGSAFAGLVAQGNGFLMLEGPEGRVGEWRRFAQPAPGQLPVLVGSGSLPPLRPRAAHPNLFRFDRDPFLSDRAVFNGSERWLDWTDARPAGPLGFNDGGPATGLGSPEPIVPGLGGGVILGNQLLADASVAGFGAVAGPARSPLTLNPPPGTYAALKAGRSFPVTLHSDVPGARIRFRTLHHDAWLLYDPSQPVELTGDAELIAYATDPLTGMDSPWAGGRYVFRTLPPPEPAPSVDLDANGLGDAWEQAFGIRDPASDTDGDGANARLEYARGTDPWDAASRPSDIPNPVVAIAEARVEAGQIHLAWPAEARGYILETSVDLLVWTPVTPQPANPQWSEALDGSGKFFRLRQP